MALVLLFVGNSVFRVAFLFEMRQHPIHARTGEVMRALTSTEKVVNAVPVHGYPARAKGSIAEPAPTWAHNDKSRSLEASSDRTTTTPLNVKLAAPPKTADSGEPRIAILRRMGTMHESVYCDNPPAPYNT